MKIGYLIGASSLVSGPYNGVLQQALSYQQALKLNGLEVTLLSPWEGKRLSEFDIVHAYGAGHELSFLTLLKDSPKTKVVLSPIIDSIQSNLAYSAYSSIHLPFLSLATPGNVTKRIANSVTKIWVRSQHEYDKVHLGLRVPAARIAKVPVCLRIKKHRDSDVLREREVACFHVSSYYQERKNVLNLVEATSRTGIKLYLAGNTPSGFEQTDLYKKISSSPHIEVLGRLSDEELIAYYEKVRVFALPSVSEGVGLVALEAGYYGSEVVITENGGPPDYFSNLAQYVNPRSVESIQAGIEKSLAQSAQPELAKYIAENYSQEAVGKRLLKEYQSLISE